MDASKLSPKNPNGDSPTVEIPYDIQGTHGYSPPKIGLGKFPTIHCSILLGVLKECGAWPTNT